MRVPQQQNSESGVGRQPWEPPTLVELKIDTETKSSSRPDDLVQFTEPAAPAAPMTKLGFYFEWGLPLSSRATE